MTHLQEFLRNGGTIQELQKTLHLSATYHEDLVLFKYHQTKSPKNDPRTIESRGIIFDRKDNWRIVSYPYDRFFNYKETKADFDEPSLVYYEKLDGSLITMYYHKDKWCVATSGMPTASGPMGKLGITFADYFWQVWGSNPLPTNTNYCYMFEITSLNNRIVIEYPEPTITLHGARDLTTLKEIDIHTLPDFCKKVQPIPYPSLKDAVEAAYAMSGFVSEGLVACDKNFNRMKIKSKQYVKLSNSAGRTEVACLIDVIKNGESAEYLTYFPDSKSLHDELQVKYNTLVDEIGATWEANKDLPCREYAKVIKPFWYKKCLNLLYCKKIDSIDEWLKRTPLKNILKNLH